jgi:hypothetical protein
MTISQEHALTAHIERTIRATPGVAALFRAGSLVSNVIDAGARVIGIRGESEPLIRLEHTPEGLRVDIAIGVEGHAGAVETIRHVGAAVSVVVEEWHRAPAEIRITVVHITDTA